MIDSISRADALQRFLQCLKEQTRLTQDLEQARKRVRSLERLYDATNVAMGTLNEMFKFTEDEQNQPIITVTPSTNAV